MTKEPDFRYYQDYDDNWVVQKKVHFYSATHYYETITSFKTEKDAIEYIRDRQYRLNFTPEYRYVDQD